MEASEHRFNSLKEARFSIASDEVRNASLMDLENCGQVSSSACIKIKACEDDPDIDDKNKKDVAVKVGRQTFSNAFRSKAHDKRSGLAHERHCREVINGYIFRNLEQTCNSTCANS